MFHWTIPQVMALTYPQFMYIRAQLEDIQYLRALYEIHFGVIAAFGDDGARKRLLHCADKLFAAEAKCPMPEYTPEAEELAKRRAEAYFARNGGRNGEM